MEKFKISFTEAGEAFEFEVINKDTAKCAYEVYSHEQLVAVFEPNEAEYIHICRNPGGLGEEIIVQIADRIEAHYL